MVFLDISKAFDKVWHEGLIFKIQKMDIVGCVLDWLKDYISERYQTVVLNGVESNICYLESWVPQGSIMGSRLFLIYSDDTDNGMERLINLFADNTSVQRQITDITIFFLTK